MAHINLLPWREWERERRKKEFLAALAGVALLGLAVIFVAGFYLDSSVDNQRLRNQFMRDRISVLDEKIIEIRNLRQKREQLLARMRVIQELQGNRPVIVRVFDELVRTLSKGVYYRSVKMSGTGIALTGTAESNNRISSLMRNLDGSEWFQEPNLKGIKENPGEGAQASDFQLSVNQTSPHQSDEES